MKKMARDVRDARVPRRPRMAESGPQGAQIGLEVIKPARRRERARLAAAYRSFRLEALVGETPEVEGDAGGRS